MKMAAFIIFFIKTLEIAKDYCYYPIVDKLITEADSLWIDAGEPNFSDLSLNGAKCSAKMNTGIIFRS